MEKETAVTEQAVSTSRERRLLPARDTGPHTFLAAVLLCAMAVGIHPRHLFGVDESREAEIARETLIDRHWITPHLCGLPFLEKPPLYYDLVAVAYRLTGSISPLVARSVSTLFGLVMLAAVFLFAYRWAGPRSAWFSALVLLAMPKFFAYSHTILLDIAVGTFCTVALVAFAYWTFWTRRSQKRKLLYLFYFACAGAFLSKGLPGLLHIPLVIGAFLLVHRRTVLLRQLVLSLPVLVFVVPVAAWIYLYYREGGIGYLHEHFINNTVGRFLHVHFALPGVSFPHTDVGNQQSWHFYLSSLPRMIGAAVAILPVALWDECKAIPLLGRSPDSRSRREADLRLLLVLWALLPPFCLSFSAIKETSYIIPSYAATAILVAVWIDHRLARAGFDGWNGAGWLVVMLPFVAVSLFLPEMGVRIYLLLTYGPLIGVIAVLVVLFHRRRFNAGAFLLLAAALSATIVYHSPNVRLQTDGCYLSLGRQIWARVGEAPLFLYLPKDSIRGSIPFSANRLTREIDLPDQLRAILSSKERAFVLMRDTAYTSTPAASIIQSMNLPITYLDDPAKPNRRLILVSNVQADATVVLHWPDGSAG